MGSRLGKEVGEDFENQIGNTNIYISRRPRLTELKEIYEVVIDLTAEFIESKEAGQSYFHLPWLDGISPSNFKIPEGIRLPPTQKS